ncbi:hypothetical protein DER29_2411 [Micromonospora sp. M71_S20]|nr:hypothetical protein DER29_2411 [Micromonospora sp. M71_S20]
MAVVGIAIGGNRRRLQDRTPPFHVVAANNRGRPSPSRSTPPTPLCVVLRRARPQNGRDHRTAETTERPRQRNVPLPGIGVGYTLHFEPASPRSAPTSNEPGHPGLADRGGRDRGGRGKNDRGREPSRQRTAETTERPAERRSKNKTVRATGRPRRQDIRPSVRRGDTGRSVLSVSSGVPGTLAPVWQAGASRGAERARLAHPTPAVPLAPPEPSTRAEGVDEAGGGSLRPGLPPPASFTEGRGKGRTRSGSSGLGVPPSSVPTSIASQIAGTGRVSRETVREGSRTAPTNSGFHVKRRRSRQVLERAGPG